MQPGALTFSLKAPYELHQPLITIGGCRYNQFRDEYVYPATPYVSLAVRQLAMGSACPISANDPFVQLAKKISLINETKVRCQDPSKLPQPLIRTFDSWEWQLQGYHNVLPLDALMLWMGVGTGKSKIICDLIQNRQHKTIILGMPNHILKDESCWDVQFERYMKDDYMFKVLDYGSSKRNAEEASQALKKFKGSKVPLIIGINYESIWRGQLGELLLACELDLLTMDESQKIRAPGGKASKYVAKLAMHAKQKVALTGSMMFNSQLDAYGQYRALDPGIFGTSYTRFRDEYAVIFDFNGAPIVKGYKNKKQLAEKIAPITVQVDANVLDLPEPQHDSRIFDLSKEERRVYDDIEQSYATETSQGYLTITNGLTKVLRLQQLTGGWLPLREDDVEAQLKRIGTSKQELLTDLLEDIPSNEPVVVFARFTADLDAIKEAAANLKRTYGEISGRAYDKVLWDKGEIQVLGINVKSGEGLNTLTRASYGIFYSVGYSNGEFDQCVGRLRRPGMRKFAYFYHLVARDTVDLAVYRALKNKTNAMQEVVTYLKNLAKAA